MTESWKPVPGFPGYEASDHGRVRSVPGTGRSRRKGTVLSTHVSDRGYLRLHMYAIGRSHTKELHITIAETFHGSRPDGAECRHLDGDSMNNSAGNLAWGTPSDNRRDSLRHGTHANARKIHCPRGHPYNDENTFRNGRGHRCCRACKRENQRLKRERARSCK